MSRNNSIHHLSSKQRIFIETFLNESYKLCTIANDLHRDPRGIKKEILNHRELFVRQNAKNKCGLQVLCKKSRLCTTCSSGLCKYCSYAKCSSLCSDFQDLPECKHTKRFPYVCNGCEQIKSCSLPKLFYKAHTAQCEYEFNVSNHKTGPRLNDIKLKELDNIISDGVRRAISIEVIIKTNNLNIAPSTVYHYIDQNLFGVKNIDLKRKVRYRQRYTSKPKAKPLNYDYLNNRRFDDFAQYLIDHPTLNVWQMDTIEGKKGESVILSLLYTKTNLQLFFKMRSKSTDEVNRVFTRIKKHLGYDIFMETFQCILTDNGREFSDPLAIEIDSQTGDVLTHVFYCDTRRSDQKGKCEKNHEHFRECIPQGISFNPYTHSDIFKISNQVNNYPRKLLGFHSPYECTLLLLNKKIFELNGIQHIPVHKVTLKYPRKL